MIVGAVPKRSFWRAAISPACLVRCQNSCRPSELGFYPRHSCSSARQLDSEGRRGNKAGLSVQTDDFTGEILDELDALGIAQDTLVV